MAQTWTLVLRKEAMDRMVAAGGKLETPTLICFQNEVTLTDRITVAELGECDFDGYADVDAVEFGAAYQDDQDNVFISAPSETFVATGDTTPNNVTGWAIVKADKTVVYYAEQFETPVAINEAGDGFVVQPTIPYGS